jgi:hypothetical protein
VDSCNAERVRLRAERDKLRATDPEGLADAWAMIEDLWSGTVARARKLPEPVLHEQVNGEWSFVQTHRHLVLATDCWLRRMVKGIARPYHPWGLGGSWLTSPRRWGIDPDADPPLGQVLDLRRERMDEVRDVIAGATAEELERNCVPPAQRPHRAAVPARGPQGGVAAPPVRDPGPCGARETAPLIARLGTGQDERPPDPAPACALTWPNSGATGKPDQTDQDEKCSVIERACQAWA